MTNYEEILNRFLEESKFDSNPNILSIVVYGSRVASINKETSDLDILAITNQANNYKMKRVIDGINVECNVFSIHFLDFIIEEKIKNNDFYFDSVLKNGVIIKNKQETVEWIKNFLEEMHYSKVDNKGVNKKLLSDLSNMLYNFYESIRLQNQDLIDYYYYNSIEYIRQIYNKKNGLSPIPLFKTYMIYSEPEKYEENYLVKLPKNSFIEKYKKSVLLTDINERKEMIEELLDLIKFNKEELKMNKQKAFFSKSNIKYTLLTFYEKKNALIESIMYNREEANSLYFVFLRQIKDFYINFYGENKEFLDLLTIALNNKNINNSIYLLEEIFSFLDNDYRYDYDDCNVNRPNLY